MIQIKTFDNGEIISKKEYDGDISTYILALEHVLTNKNIHYTISKKDNITSFYFHNQTIVIQFEEITIYGIMESLVYDTRV